MKKRRLKAPFPWFGGKSRVADLVWERFGATANYVEPFFGSGAVMLARPFPVRTETVNDLDCFIANFWRAVQKDPGLVALWADWPVNEADLHARHLWLVKREEFRERIKADPEYYDAKIAGWWVWMFALADRLRRTRVCCGDWTRVLGRSPTECIGVTGIFLDPPYSAARDSVYSIDSREVAHDVREWAIAHGDNPMLRIALCGYQDEHEMPAGWSMLAWKANGGHANASKAGRGRANAAKERIWFSPHCLEPKSPDLFAQHV